jgi:hypothetical protein
MSKQNTILLSKTATAVYKATDLTRAECNLIGQFCGTDLRYYKKGDLIVRATEKIGWTHGFPRHAPIRLVNPNAGEGSLRWFWGKKYCVYEVKRRTACRIQAKELSTFTAYTTFHFALRNWNGGTPFDVNRIAGLFEAEHIGFPLRTLTPCADDSGDAAELEVLKSLYKVTNRSGKEVKYDLVNEELVLVESSEFVVPAPPF